MLEGGTHRVFRAASEELAKWKHVKVLRGHGLGIGVMGHHLCGFCEIERVRGDVVVSYTLG